MPITITMPALSPTMTEGTLAKWLVKEGDQVSAGDVIAEIETDKATMEVEAADEGVVEKLLVAEGAEGVAVNTPIALLRGEDEAPGAAAKAAAPPAPAAPKTEPAPAPRTDGGAAPAQARDMDGAKAARRADDGGRGERIFASPLARRMAQQAGLDLATLKGSGPHGRIVKADVDAALAKGAPPKPAPAPAAARAPAAPEAPPAARGEYEPEFELEKLSQMRKVIARRMSESKREVPHFYLTVDCEIDALLKLRKELNAKLGDSGKLSVNDLVIKAAALALMKVPAANSAYSEEGLKRYKTADISVAVATERGLITPVIRNAESKGLQAISAEMRELAERARQGKLMPEDYLGGSFSISNLGMYGVKQFDAVINPPQACILAVGAGEPRPVVKDGALAIATVMSCTLSTDHRAVDGAIGAEWLAAFKKLVEDPLQMLL